MEERITQEPPRSKTEQDLEQRAMPGRVRFHRDEEEHEERSCGDQHCGPQCLEESQKANMELPNG